MCVKLRTVGLKKIDFKLRFLVATTRYDNKTYVHANISNINTKV